MLPRRALGGSQGRFTLPEALAGAWVSFDGSTATPTINGSLGVASITDVGAGNYVINWTHPFFVSGAATRYACFLLPKHAGVGAAGDLRVGFLNGNALSATGANVQVTSMTPGAADPTQLTVLAVGMRR